MRTFSLDNYAKCRRHCEKVEHQVSDVMVIGTLKADTLGEILWADTFFHQPQRLQSPVNSPLSQASLSILKEYSKKFFLKF